MHIHFVSGKHFTVPGTLTTAHGDAGSAATEAMRLVGMMAEDLQTRIEPVAVAADWPSYLAQVQKARIMETDGVEAEDEDDLAGMSDCNVEIQLIEMADPRVVVKIKGGMVESVSSDIPIVAHVVDYNTESADEKDIHQIPEGMFRGKMRTKGATVETYSGKEVVVGRASADDVEKAIAPEPVVEPAD